MYNIIKAVLKQGLKIFERRISGPVVDLIKIISTAAVLMTAYVRSPSDDNSVGHSAKLEVLFSDI